MRGKWIKVSAEGEPPRSVFVEDTREPRKPTDDEVLTALKVKLTDYPRRKQGIEHVVYYYFQHEFSEPMYMPSWSQIQRMLKRGEIEGSFTSRRVERGHFRYFEWRRLL